jgi:hypothetical protein
MYDTLGKVAVRFALAYMRRRYKREIRIAIGVAAVGIGVGAYLASRNVPEG